MAYCSNCGHEVQRDIKFCVFCGAPAEKRPNDVSYRSGDYKIGEKVLQDVVKYIDEHYVEAHFSYNARESYDGLEGMAMPYDAVPTAPSPQFEKKASAVRAALIRKYQVLSGPAPTTLSEKVVYDFCIFAAFFSSAL